MNLLKVPSDQNGQADQDGHNDQNDQYVQTDEILNDDQSEHFNHTNAEQIIDNLLSSNLGARTVTRAMAKELSAASAHKCLFVDSLSEEEPKRIFLAFATYMNFIVYQMDVKSAFLNGKLKEEVYIKQPLGFESSFDLKGYLDFNYARCNMDRKSTLGAYQLLEGKLMCWSDKKRQYVAMSSAEAEYVAAAGCCANILWMKSQLIDCDIIYENVPIFCNNTSAIAISNNPVLHSRTKHIDIRYNFIRDCILKGDIELHFIPTQYQLDDIFTKALDEPTFKRLIVELDQVEFSFEEIALTTNNEVALLYPSHPKSDYFAVVSDLISKFYLKDAFIRAPTKYKEYLCEFWYTAKTLDDSKI
ncbi:retrovirus-related pol polyprotein from transposon TNT 1-94 [Tanacetum coccineum]